MTGNLLNICVLAIFHYNNLKTFYIDRNLMILPKGLSLKELVQLVLADTVIILVVNYFSPIDWTTVVAIYISTILVSMFSKRNKSY